VSADHDISEPDSCRDMQQTVDDLRPLPVIAVHPRNWVDRCLWWCLRPFWMTMLFPSFERQQKAQRETAALLHAMRANVMRLDQDIFALATAKDAVEGHLKSLQEAHDDVATRIGAVDRSIAASQEVERGFANLRSDVERELTSLREVTTALISDKESIDRHLASLQQAQDDLGRTQDDLGRPRTNSHRRSKITAWR